MLPCRVSCFLVLNSEVGISRLALTPKQKIHIGEQPSASLESAVLLRRLHHRANQTTTQLSKLNTHIATSSNLQTHQISHIKHERNGLVRTTNGSLPSKRPGYFARATIVPIDTKTRGTSLTRCAQQTERRRAARAAGPHGAQADEGLHERTCQHIRTKEQ
jgi:hypothetical protein